MRRYVRLNFIQCALHAFRHVGRMQIVQHQDMGYKGVACKRVGKLTSCLLVRIGRHRAENAPDGLSVNRQQLRDKLQNAVFELIVGSRADPVQQAFEAGGAIRDFILIHLHVFGVFSQSSIARRVGPVIVPTRRA